MSAQPAIAPTRRPRWTPVVVPGPDAAPSGHRADQGVARTAVPSAPDDVAAVRLRAATPSAQPVLRPAPRAPRTAAAGGGTGGPSVASLAPATRAIAWRRRATAASLLVAVAVTFAGLLGPGTADAGPTDPVAGSVTIAPGQTLWDVAVATAPEGTDTRDQLSRIVALNGFDGDQPDAWTVVLLPAR